MLHRTAAIESDLETCGKFWLAMFDEIGVDHSSWRADWRDRFCEYFRRRAVLNEARWFVCEGDGNIVGTACGILRDGYPNAITGARSGYILGVSVLPNARRIGVA